MRRIFAVLLALVLAMSTIGAFAEENHEVAFEKGELGAPLTDLTMDDYIDSWTAIYYDELELGIPEAHGYRFVMDIDGEKAVVNVKDANGESSFESPVVLEEDGCIAIQVANGATLRFHIFDSENMVQIVEEGAPYYVLQRTWVAEICLALMAKASEMTDEELDELEAGASVLNDIAVLVDSITDEDIEMIADIVDGVGELFKLLGELTLEDVEAIEAKLDSITDEDVENFAQDVLDYVDTLSEEEQAEFDAGLEVLESIFAIFE